MTYTIFLDKEKSGEKIKINKIKLTYGIAVETFVINFLDEKDISKPKECINIYLDDCRVPTEGSWTVVKNFKEFVFLLDYCKRNNINILHISFDHDLGDFYEEEGVTKERTGYTCVQYFLDWFKNLDFYSLSSFGTTRMNIHSSNIVGAKNIEHYVEKYFIWHRDSKMIQRKLYRNIQNIKYQHRIEYEY